MILTVDSSTNIASVSLIHNGELLYYYHIDDGKTHSQKLMPMIDECFKKTGSAPSDIDAFAAITGPGSFTGLRIGIAAIQGLAYSAKKPCIAVSSLDAMAYGIKEKKCIAVSLIDARNAQAYSAAYRFRPEFNKLMGDRADSVSEIVMDISNITDKALFIGDGAYKNKSIILDSFKGEALFLDEGNSYTAGKGAALLAQEYFDDKKIMPPEKLMPYYIRETSAKKKFK